MVCMVGVNDECEFCRGPRLPHNDTFRLKKLPPWARLLKFALLCARTWGIAGGIRKGLPIRFIMWQDWLMETGRGIIGARLGGVNDFLAVVGALRGRGMGCKLGISRFKELIGGVQIFRRTETGWEVSKGFWSKVGELITPWISTKKSYHGSLFDQTYFWLWIHHFLSGSKRKCRN